MRQRTIKVNNRLGLHARAAAKVVRLSHRFKSQLTLCRVDNHRQADAKSIFGILTLAATQGTELVLTASGEDEEMAVRQMAALIEAQLEESDGSKGKA